MTHRTLAPLLAALALGGCAVDPGTDPGADPVAAHADAIQNGAIWNPWTNATDTWSRNVVQVSQNGGCTGTLIRPQWVLTAGHCFSSAPGPSSVTVRHTQSNGTVVTYPAVELLRHPDEANGTDVALIRIDPPAATAPALPLYAGSTPSLVGTSLRCFGYGATAVGAACGAGLPACGAGEFCQWGRCFTANTGELRTGLFPVIADPVDAARWFRFDVPNAQGQMLAPGDSGSSCTLNGQIAGVTKAGNATDYNRLTSVAAFRDWVLGIVDPAEVDLSNRPALACRSTGAGVTPAASGAIANPNAAEVTVMCPIARRTNAAGTFSNVVSAPRVFVDDRSAAGDVCCAVVATDATGLTTAGPERCSTGSAGNNDPLTVGELPQGPTFSSYALRCRVPGVSAGVASRLLGYRIFQGVR